MEKKSMLEELREHLANTPQEQLDKEWNEICELTKDMESPTVSEYLSGFIPNIVPFKYKDVENKAKEAYPDNVGNRYAFKSGVIWAIEQVYVNKTREEIFDEMQISRITLD